MLSLHRNQQYHCNAGLPVSPTEQAPRIAQPSRTPDGLDGAIEKRINLRDPVFAELIYEEHELLLPSELPESSCARLVLVEEVSERRRAEVVAESNCFLVWACMVLQLNGLEWRWLDAGWSVVVERPYREYEDMAWTGLSRSY